MLTEKHYRTHSNFTEKHTREQKRKSLFFSVSFDFLIKGKNTNEYVHMCVGRIRNEKENTSPICRYVAKK